MGSKTSAPLIDSPPSYEVVDPLLNNTKTPEELSRIARSRLAIKVADNLKLYAWKAALRGYTSCVVDIVVLHRKKDLTQTCEEQPTSFYDLEKGHRIVRSKILRRCYNYKLLLEYWTTIRDYLTEKKIQLYLARDIRNKDDTRCIILNWDLSNKDPVKSDRYVSIDPVEEYGRQLNVTEPISRVE